VARKQSDTLAFRMVAISLGMHVLIAAIAIGTMTLGERKPIVQNAIQTRLVRLGENKPEWLPRKEEPPPAPKEAPTPIAIDSKAVTIDKKTPAKEDNHSKFEDIMKHLDQVAKKEDYKGKGDARGSKQGTVSDFTLQTIGMQYATDLDTRIRPNYTVPAVIPEDERARLQASIVLYIAADGRVIKAELGQRSGNPLFDAALVRAIKASSPMPPPPPELREQVARDGFEITFSGKR
jgi:colicin import membrane protein